MGVLIFSVHVFSDDLNVFNDTYMYSSITF